MVLLWSRWDYTRGACPECHGEGIGFTFAGGLSLAYVTGVCLSCGLVVHRTAHGLGAVVSGIRQALQGTPYPVSGSQTRAHSPPVALIAVLAELGETGLPDPRAPGLAPPYVRCSKPQEDTTNAGHAHDTSEEAPVVPRPRAPKTRDRHPERLTRDGAVLLSHNHISLLQGLLDRPGGRAKSKRDLIAAAQPYVRRYRASPPSWWTMNLATYTLHPSWVNWRRKGGRLIYRLLARGTRAPGESIQVERPVSGFNIVAGVLVDASVVMIPEDEAMVLDQLYDALGARTWGEFRQQAPEAWYQSALERTFGEEDEAPDPVTPFDREQIWGYCDGDWPAWPQQRMLEWVPKQVQADFGNAEASCINGSFLSIEAMHVDKVIAAMEALGYRCRRDDDLVARVSGY